MAGIAGWVDWERDVSREPGRLMAMGAALAHRGRDQAGMWIHPPAALVCRTGSLDLTGQPAAYGPDGVESGGDALVLVADALPTNLAALRRELSDDPVLAGGVAEVAAGADSVAGMAAGAGGAAVLLAGYRRWGDGLLERLDGVFALAIWDGRRQRLLLARDRLGVRPLFYAVRQHGLLFASELKGLLAHPSVPPEIDAEGLAELLAMSPNRTPGHGVFRGVREVAPGGLVVWDRDGLKARRYWHLTARPHRDTPMETVATVRQLLSAAVTGQAGAAAAQGRTATVTIGSMLSGGLDSTAVVALLQESRQAGAPPLRTYSVEHGGSERYFRPNAYQPDADGPWVARAVARYGTQHDTVTLDPARLAAALDEAMRGRDLPGMADIDAALYLFCQDIAQTSTAVLSGEGADELFGGYPWFFQHSPGAARDAVPHFPWLTQLELRWGLLHPDVRRLCRPEAHLAARYEEQVAAAPALPGEAETEARQRALTFHNLTAWGPVLIERSDRMGQQAGVHVLMPFCDHHLVEYVFNVPWALKAAAGERKSLLRQAVADLLPPDLLKRPKSPFPKTHNPVFLRAVQRRLLERLSDSSCRLPDIFDRSALRALVTDPGELDLPWFGQLMRLPQLLAWLLQFDAWLEGYRVTLI